MGKRWFLQNPVLVQLSHEAFKNGSKFDTKNDEKTLKSAEKQGVESHWFWKVLF